MAIERHEGEGMTEFTMRRIRHEIIEECAQTVRNHPAIKHLARQDDWSKTVGSLVAEAVLALK